MKHYYFETIETTNVNIGDIFTVSKTPNIYDVIRPKNLKIKFFEVIGKKGYKTLVLREIKSKRIETRKDGIFSEFNYCPIKGDYVSDKLYSSVLKKFTFNNVEYVVIKDCIDNPLANRFAYKLNTDVLNVSQYTVEF